MNRFFLSLFVSIFLWTTACNSPKPETVTIFSKGYGAHVELPWPKAENAKSYTILASTDGENFTERATTSDTLHLDFVKDLGEKLSLLYRIEVNSDTGKTELGTAEVTIQPLTDDQLLDMVEFYTFRYFWNGTWFQ